MRLLGTTRQHLAEHGLGSTVKKIASWLGNRALYSGSNPSPYDLQPTSFRAMPAAISTLIRSGQMPLRVLTYRWHVPHQYELWKLPIHVTIVTGAGSGMSDHWDYGQRPLPGNARFRALDDINPRDYDLAILHFDENVLAPENTNGVIGPEWGAAFKLFREQFDLPKVGICHGTPQFRGQYNIDYAGADLMQPIEAERQRLVDYLGDIHVVCNSYQAQAEWRFRQSSVIWHGFDPAEFPPATYERGILSPLGPLVLSRPHYRGYFLYRQVFDGHYDQLRPETLQVPEPQSQAGNAYALAKFRAYVNELRRYSVYFNPTLRSPMPRARGEPMMCGLVTVSARNHDVDRFIENGVDGFYAEDADELRSQLYFLVRSPDVTRRVGAASRAKAINVFHIQRYLADWKRLIYQVV
jgi:Glycosyl transferases group 1